MNYVKEYKQKKIPYKIYVITKSLNCFLLIKIIINVYRFFIIKANYFQLISIHFIYSTNPYSIQANYIIRYFYQLLSVMFSYLSTTTKNDHNNYETNLIEQIQTIANQIFDHHTTSYAKTQQQQMSLQLSPATSEDNFQIKRYNQDHQNQQENYFSQLRQYKNNNLFFIDESQKSQKNQSHKNQNLQKNDSFDRMSKSVIFRSNFKEQGSFSNKYLGSNLSSSNVSNNMKIKKTQLKQENQNQTPLKKSNLNKSNILMGILNQKNSNTGPKSKSKGKLFNKSYASNYISPYSTKMIKENPKAYMEKTSVSPFSRKAKQTVQLQYIKRRINQNIQPQISYRKQKSQNSKLKNPKLTNIKSKYRQFKPMLHQYKLYVDEHIYKKTKEEMSVWQQKKKLMSMRTPQQIQQTWDRFIHNQSRLLEEKKQRILSMQLQKMHNQNTQHFVSPTKNIILNSGKQKAKKINPPTLTPQDFVKKYKREKEKLKEKLQANQISNFLQRNYDDMKKMGPHAFESSWGSTLKFNQKINQADKFSTIKVSDFSTIKQNSKVDESLMNNKKQIQEQQQPTSVPHQNFFISVENEQEYIDFKKKKSQLSAEKQQNFLSRSSVYQSYRKKQRNSYSTQRKSINNYSAKKTSIQRTSLSPFMKKNYPLQTNTQLEPFVYDPRKHNSASFNESLVSSKSNKKRTPTKQHNSNKVSQLLNPKYFRSINQLEQYSSNSRQKIQKPKKTFKNEIQYNDFMMNKHYLNRTDMNQNNQYTTPNKRLFNKNRAISTLAYENQIDRVHSQKINNQRRNVITKFDHNLMKKTIQDLEKMRVEIQQNKKKRKFAIENYRNFSNVRKDQQINHDTGPYFNQPYEQEKSLGNQRNQNEKSKQKQFTFKNQIPSQRQKHLSTNKRQNILQRNNQKNNSLSSNRFQRSKSPIQKQGPIKIQTEISSMGRSRSVSPIHQQDISLSAIHPINQSSYKNENPKSSQVQEFNSRLFNSNIIMVKNRKEIQFIMNIDQ